jgi:glyoxylase-like metal-dependent hydrolase (beta-lactamase superfamily II)
MRVHHLDCCTMCPATGKLLNDQGRMVAHCLLVETPRDGLVLVDTGIGLDDCARPRERLGAPFVAITGLRPDPMQTAARQLEQLGFRREDVRHIVVTHLDLDHAGGLPDFPHATVHVHGDEHQAAVVVRAFAERPRYRECHWAHGPKFAKYSELAGDRWFGFDRAKPLSGLSTDEIVAIPLAGHSRGHSVIAVKSDRWLLHAGDAYFHEGTVDESREKPRFGVAAFERTVAWDFARVRENHRRLRELHRTHGHELTVFCAHDPNELARARARTQAPASARAHAQA